MKNLKIEELTCCSWHTPRNAIVHLKTGAIVPKEALDRIPDGPAKDMMLYSGNMCDPCARKLCGGRWDPKAETIMAASSK
ncbi:hypothetical protein L0Y65_06790 [Candidatus Micrarchaeota archaeon]|nr:hypothetical protein [Candidatus Micrarchaeota archaeon]